MNEKVPRPALGFQIMGSQEVCRRDNCGRIPREGGGRVEEEGDCQENA